MEVSCPSSSYPGRFADDLHRQIKREDLRARGLTMLVSLMKYLHKIKNLRTFLIGNYCGMTEKERIGESRNQEKVKVFNRCHSFLCKRRQVVFSLGLVFTLQSTSTTKRSYTGLSNVKRYSSSFLTHVESEGVKDGMNHDPGCTLKLNTA